MNNQFNGNNQEYDFQMIEQLKDTPINCSIAFNEENEKNNNNEMNETIIDNLIKKSNINFPNIKQNYNSSFIISPEEMASIIKHLDVNNFIKKNESINNDYIKPRKIKSISKEEFNKYLNKFNIKNIKSLIEEILNYKINTTFYSKKNSIGPCIGIIHLIESSFGFDKKQIKSMMEKYKNLKNYNFFRPVKGDGNCYYRGFMYKYLETIILNNDIELFKDLLLNFEDCFNDKITKKYLKVSSNNIIKPEKIKNILVAIYYSIYEKNIKKSLRILNSAFNLSKNFDIALILFFRYELYKFINENQFKFYTETFPVLIGNLLPAEYETKDGKFLYQKFYEKYLLKLFTDAEKIVIYLTPFIFPIKLNIILFKASSNEFIQEFYCKNYNKKDYIITLINKKLHYEVIYEVNEYIKFEEYLINYTNYNIESVFLSNFINKQFQTQKILTNNKVSNNQNDKKNYNTINNQNVVPQNQLYFYPVYINYDNQMKEPNNYKTFQQPLQVYYLSNQNNQYNNPISNGITNPQIQFQNNCNKTESNTSYKINPSQKINNNYPIYNNPKSDNIENNNINNKNINLINDNNNYKVIQKNIDNNNNYINRNNNFNNNKNISNKDNNIINKEDKNLYKQDNILEYDNKKDLNKENNNNNNYNNNILINNNQNFKSNNNENINESLNKKNNKLLNINQLENKDSNQNHYNLFKDPLTAHLYFINNKNIDKENTIEETNFNFNQLCNVKKNDEKNNFQNKRLTDKEIEEKIISILNSITINETILIDNITNFNE